MKGNRTALQGLLYGTLTGIGVGLAGFLLSITPKTQGMGFVMFGLVPFCAGFTIALVTRQPETGWAAMLLSALLSLTILVATKLEGVLCAILAFPLLGLGLAIGAIIGYLFRRFVLERSSHQVTGTFMLFALTPGVIVAGHIAELPSLKAVRVETVSSSVRLTVSPEIVWQSIQSIDSIRASKPLLMHFGLPIPLRCTLERKGVGARRTCYFENGFIQETITAWDPPYSMQLSIDRTNLPGRHWLGFERADYELRPEGNATQLTRTTTITSHLYPVWYWRYFERLGVSSEHDYILRDLADRLNK